MVKMITYLLLNLSLPVCVQPSSLSQFWKQSVRNGKCIRFFHKEDIIHVEVKIIKLSNCVHPSSLLLNEGNKSTLWQLVKVEIILKIH